jgi:hypothetical protein
MNNGALIDNGGFRFPGEEEESDEALAARPR